MSAPSCACGCGEPTKLKDPRWPGCGYNRYVKGHNTRLSPVEYLVDEETGCWVWQRSHDGRGYGNIVVDGKTHLAHRVYYVRAKGPIPEGLQIDHLCMNKGCVNPDHLEAVTGGENLRRWAATLTHCPQGHEINEVNAYYAPSGRRACRACRRSQAQKRRATATRGM